LHGEALGSLPNRPGTARYSMRKCPDCPFDVCAHHTTPEPGPACGETGRWQGKIHVASGSSHVRLDCSDMAASSSSSSVPKPRPRPPPPPLRNPSTRACSVLLSRRLNRVKCVALSDESHQSVPRPQGSCRGQRTLDSQTCLNLPSKPPLAAMYQQSVPQPASFARSRARRESWTRGSTA